MGAPPHRRARRLSGFLLLVLASGLYGVDLLRSRQIAIRPAPLIPSWSRQDGRDIVALRDRYLVAELARYDDEFYGYLMYTYLRGAPEYRDSELLLTYVEAEGRIVYPLQVRVPNDLISAIPRLAAAGASSWRYLTDDALGRLRGQTHLFGMAYAMPGRLRLEDLNRVQLTGFIRRWLRFKSATDPRIRRRIEPVPTALGSEAAQQMAEDIVSVAEFYAVPLDFFLGIGAMENNYMNVAGDLDHAIWKRRADQDDVILKRQRGRVLVVNSSLGAWQITRETLRYAHRRYLRDDRDYSRLPERLRPARELDVLNVPPAVLTTYAGLLFRDLLDRCGGDVTLATGAYNGGLGRPNLKYADGVRAVAEYARRTLEHAAVLNGPAAGRRFLTR
jgi:hypothetical protein